MTTENLEGKPETPEAPETNQETIVQPSPTEVAARDQGWVSKEEWVEQGKDPDSWRSAKEFIERGELFEEIHKLKDSTKKTTAAFKALVEHHKKVYENAVKEAIARLKAEKKEAIENQDMGRVFELDEEIDRVKSQPVPMIEVPEVDVEPSPTFKAWHKQNNWYSLDGEDEASLYANTVGFQFRKKNPHASEKEFLEEVEKKVARRFPELFENPNASRAREVNPARGETPGGKDVFKLTDEEERVCKLLVDQGVMTRKQYVDELKKVK